MITSVYPLINSFTISTNRRLEITVTWKPFLFEFPSIPPFFLPNNSLTFIRVIIINPLSMEIIQRWYACFIYPSLKILLLQITIIK